MSKKLIHAWQEVSRKWVVRMQRVLKRRTWRERVKQTTGTDPLVCPRCECYDEYMGEVCPQEGELRVKYARSRTAHVCMERMIGDLTGIQKTKASQKEKDQSAYNRAS